MTSVMTSVVLGGTSGIGACIARRIADPDEILVLNYLQNRERAEALAVELPGEVHLIQGNVAESAVVTRIADAVNTPCRRLIHSVALTAFKPLSEIRRNQWDLTMSVSARSLLAVTTALQDRLAEARGSVVAISSQGSIRHVPSYGALGPAKAALESIVRELAVELADHGVRVNAVRAGLVEGKVTAFLGTDLTRTVIGRTPLGRLARPEEVASVATFLSDEDASWITGQVIDVDGGFGLV